MKLGAITPVLRSFDAAKAREFYVDFLGFGVDWEHRFDADAPLFMQVSRDGCVLWLSEHHGDATPGARVVIETSGVDAWCAQLVARNYRNCRPAVEPTPWGSRDMKVLDPSGNALVFSEREPQS